MIDLIINRYWLKRDQERDQDSDEKEDNAKSIDIEAMDRGQLIDYIGEMCDLLA
jgi:hypothetical protein